jgi:hypothetical protein
MPGIITPSLPFAGAIALGEWESLCGWESPLTSTRARFDATFADFFLVAIILALPQ